MKVRQESNQKAESPELSNLNKQRAISLFIREDDVEDELYQLRLKPMLVELELKKIQSSDKNLLENFGSTSHLNWDEPALASEIQSEFSFPPAQNTTL